MSPIFQCPGCRREYRVEASLAGRKARCKHCGAAMQIPEPGARLEPQAAAAAAAGPAPRVPDRPLNWLDAVTSQVGLAPLTDLPPMARPSLRPSALDDATSTGLYAVLSAPAMPPVTPGGRISRPAGAGTIAYRKELGRVQRLFRWLNESAYLVSVPFLMALMLGVVVHSRSLALLGATVVVLLNLWRLVTGLLNLLVIPFRESPIQGLLFLLPPYTLYYLYVNWGRVEKPARRIIEPLLTILAVVLTFAFVPWLAAGDSGPAPPAPPAAGVRGRLETGVEGVRSGMREKLERAQEVGSDAAARARGADR